MVTAIVRVKITAANRCVCTLYVWLANHRATHLRHHICYKFTSITALPLVGRAVALWAENTQLNLVAAKFGLHHLGVVVCGVITVSAASDSESQFLPGDQYVVGSAAETMTIYLELGCCYCSGW